MNAARASILFATLLAASACAPRARHRAMTETIGGAVRDRAFASATAYEAFLRAEVAINHNDLEEAARQLELATFADDSDGWLCARRAEVLALAGQRDEGLEAARGCARRFSEQAASWIVLGEILVERGRRDEANAAFSRALTVAPDDPEVRESVAVGQGASPSSAASAREASAQARPGDRTIAQRTLLDQGRDRRPTLATLRRQRARDAMARGAFSTVDSLLTPLYVSQRATVEDRVALIEARAGDGRANEAAPIVSSLTAGEGAGSVSVAQLARLWLLVGRADLALEACERGDERSHDASLLRRLQAEALGRVGRASEALTMFATIDSEDGEFVEAQVQAAQTLVRAARVALADAVLVRALVRLGQGASRALERDRLRIARAQLPLQTSSSALDGLETAWGRQQRGMLLARSGSTDAAVLRDLRERSGDRREDARADAWLALRCTTCGPTERQESLRAAMSGASEDPVTLLARAAQTADRAESEALRRRALQRDPFVLAPR